MKVEKPLKRRMKIKREGAEGSWINFKYERLSTFCFVCGKLGHSERDCSVVYANPDKMVARAYGLWLRAPTKNASMNVGSRWLRNNNDGNKTWSSGGTSSGTSNTSKEGGGELYAARFMEVDGMVTEINGDGDVVKVIERESRNGDNVNKIQNQMEIYMGGKEKEREVVVTDSKRKRVNEISDGGFVGDNDNLSVHENSKNGSKNGQVVGSVIQAHQSL